MVRISVSFREKRRLFPHAMNTCVELHNSASRIDWIFRITWKHLRHDVRPETLYVSGRTSCRKCFHVILNIQSIRLALLIGCKHRASEGVFYIGGRGFVCQIIEPVTFPRCAFIFALRNIALGGYLDARRNI